MQQKKEREQMEQLLLKYYLIYLLFLLGLLFLLIEESIALAVMVRLHGRDWRYVLPEVIALVLSFLFFVYGSLWWNQGEFSFGPPTDLSGWRWLLGTMALLCGCFCGQARRPSPLLACAGIATLPLFDVLRPLNMLAFALLLLVRLFLNWRWESNRLHLRVNVTSIGEALDDLPMGILFAQKNGRVVLVNVAMLHWMEVLCGRQFRNLHDFRAALQNFDRPAIATKRHHNQEYLFRLHEGQSILFRCQWLEKMRGWQMTAMDVTELDRVNIEMEQQNAKLMQGAYEQKELLRSIEATESRRTLQKVALRVHDIMGSRISMLQQLLQSPRAEDVLKIIPRLDTMLQDIRFDEVVQPDLQMQDLFAIYRRLGLELTVTGQLPHNRKRARTFVEIMREGLNNAVVHGHASRITINLAERELQFRDDGIGVTGALRLGTGLRGISQRAQAIGAVLHLETQPHFTMIVRVEGKKSGEKHTRAAGR